MAATEAAGLLSKELVSATDEGISDMSDVRSNADADALDEDPAIAAKAASPAGVTNMTTLILVVAAVTLLTTMLTMLLVPIMRMVIVYTIPRLIAFSKHLISATVHALLTPFIALSSLAAHTPSGPAPYSCHQTYSTTILSHEPLLIHISGFLHPQESEALIAQASPHLAPARVIMPETGGEQVMISSRDSGSAFLQHNLTREQECVFARITAMTRSPANAMELFSVSRYSKGQKFDWHKDWIAPATLQSGSDWWARFGQRTITVQVYLTEATRGGETAFSGIKDGSGGNLRIKPRQGDALLFYNVHGHADNAVEDERMVYSEEPVQEGEKWVLNSWIRAKVGWMKDKEGLWSSAQ